MKLTSLALACAFALTSTVALAYTNQSTHHHKYRSGARTHSGYSMNQGRYYGSYGRYNGGYGRYNGNPNDRGGLVGGGDPGTYKP